MTFKSYKVPEHIAIIMDGNGRWATKHSVKKIDAYKKGAAVAKNIANECNKLGVKFLTLFAFSSENWNRPQKEVNSLMSLFKIYLKNNIKSLDENNIKIRFIGNHKNVKDDVKNLMNEAVERSQNNDGMTLVIALSYGGRNEIEDAAYNIIKKALIIDETKRSQLINDENKFKEYFKFEDFLYTKDIPYPDLLIRTSGEHRISNFLLWQIAYSELYFTNVLWPDFTKDNLITAINEFQKRERRYGK